MPYILKAKPLAGYRAKLTFSDGLQKIVELRPHLKGPLFGELVDRRKFRLLRVGEGGGLEWPNGADICPSLLYHDGPAPWAKTSLKGKMRSRRKTAL